MIQPGGGRVRVLLSQIGVLIVLAWAMHEIVRFHEIREGLV